MFIRVLLIMTAAYVRFFPFKRGKIKIINWVCRMSSPNTSIITKSNDGRYFEFLPYSRQAYQIFFWGTREKCETEFVSRVLRRGDNAIDIGANIGWYTTLISQNIGPNGRALAIEPVPNTFTGLKKSLELNQSPNNYVLLNIACSDKVGDEIIFEFPGLHPGLSSGRTYEGSHSIQHKVKTETLDNLIEEFDFQKVHLVKIDVEGGELAVLRGGVKSLAASKIEALMIEANQERCLAFGYEFEECINLIQNCNNRFSFYKIMKENVGLQKMKNRSDFNNGDNIFAVLEESEMRTRIECESNLLD
jgi:FkbM family methyltransferase